MRLTFEADTLGELTEQITTFLDDANATYVETETAVKASKPKKKKAAKPEPVEEVKEALAEEPEPEKDDEMDIEDMREAMRQDMMAIYTNPDGKKFVEDKLSEYSLKNFSELPENKVEEVFTSVREFRQELAA